MNYYYHGLIRKYIIMFGQMFNDISVVRMDNNGNAKQTIRIPISYGPKEKFLARLEGDPDLDKEVAIQLPRLSFELIAMNYAPNRTVNKTNKSYGPQTGTGVTAGFAPVPYDFQISLYGMFANQEDAVQVTEQILPYFRPEWTHTIKLQDDIGDYYDVPTVLQDVTIEDSYESDFSTRRAIIYSWNFTVKGYLMGPVSNKGVIKRTVIDMQPVDTDGEMPDTTTGPTDKIVLTPKMADGSDVNYLDINETDDWTYSFENLDYFDGIERHDH